MMKKKYCPFRDVDGLSECLTSSCGCWNWESCCCGLIHWDESPEQITSELKKIRDELSNIHGAIKGEK